MALFYKVDELKVVSTEHSNDNGICTLYLKDINDLISKDVS
jgi:hypothetical protein